MEYSGTTASLPGNGIGLEHTGICPRRRVIAGDHTTNRSIRQPEIRVHTSLHPSRQPAHREGDRRLADDLATRGGNRGMSASASECPAALGRERPARGVWRWSQEHGGRRDTSPVPPASFGPDVRNSLGDFDPDQPGTSQEVFLVACNSFVHKHLQWRRGESNPRPATDSRKFLRA